MLTFTKHTQRSADHTKESKMNEFETDRLNDEALDDDVLNGEALEEVSGGTAQAAVRVKDITPIWVKVSASPLYCRYTPGGKIAKVYEKGHRLKVDGITADGNWYRLLINDHGGGACYAYVAKKYTREL